MHYTVAILHSPKKGLAIVDLTDRLAKGLSLTGFCLEILGIEHDDVSWMFMFTHDDLPEEYTLEISMPDGERRWDFTTVDPIGEIWTLIGRHAIDVRKLTSLSLSAKRDIVPEVTFPKVDAPVSSSRYEWPLSSLIDPPMHSSPPPWEYEA